MGGDGGSIPRREELVRSKKKPQRAERRVANAALWRHCALTQDPLRPPIVSCRLGRLYNKESVINKLLNRSNGNQSADHIRRLKDVRELRLTINKSHTASSDPLQDDSAEFYCPITGLEMSGAHAFIYLWPCGCVFSKKALEAVQDKLCMTCGTPFNTDDIVLINPQTEEELEAAKSRLLSHQQSTSTNKTKKRPMTLDPPKISISKQTTDTPHEESVTKAKKPALGSSTLSGTQASTSSRSHPTQSSGSDSSIQQDPNASSVYKSLFTTSEEARRQPKAHWVTFNPLYFR